MAELRNRRLEQFSQLLAIGMPAVDAHAKSGYRRDKGNASKAARRPEVVQRVKEIQAADPQRQALARGDVELTGVAATRVALEGAIQASNWSAAGSIAVAMAKADGSFEQLQSDKPLSREEIVRQADALGPVMGLSARMACPHGSFERLVPPDRDIQLAEIGLANWFSEGQLAELGRRLVGRVRR